MGSRYNLGKSRKTIKRKLLFNLFSHSRIRNKISQMERNFYYNRNFSLSLFFVALKINPAFKAEIGTYLRLSEVNGS